MADLEATTARRTRRRLVTVGVLFLLGFLVVLARSVQLQVLERSKYAVLAHQQQVRRMELKPIRGAITDASGRRLAVSVEGRSAFVDARAVPEQVTVDGRTLPTDEALAKALGVERAGVARKLGSKQAFQWLQRRLDPDKVAAVEKIRTQNRLVTGVDGKTPVEWLGFAREYQRFYPQRSLASHVVGLVGIDDEGLEGVEFALEQRLRGQGKRIGAKRNVRGKLVLDQPGVHADALFGADVELTLDGAIQSVAEEALARGVAKARAVGGSIVVLDPHTGAVLALANVPDFNPNAPSATNERRNRAVTDLYEPGSTMKSFVFAGAIEDGIAKPGTWVHVSGGELPLGKKKIRDSHKPDRDDLTLTEVLATSSNVGTARIGLKMGAPRLVEWLRLFGFGERTGLGLPGEARGVLQDPRRMGEIATATTSFGQGMSATPLQVATALAAIANGGNLMRPYVVRRVVEADGAVVVEAKPEVVRRVVSRETAAAVTQMMVAVTEKGGTGTLAAIPGMQVAGKTGTAQKAKATGRGYGDKRYSSFMGFAPADAPRVAIYVALDEPQGDVYGGVVAAPVFREVAVAALRQLGLVFPNEAAELAQAEHVEARKAASSKASRALAVTVAPPPPPPATFEEGFVEEGEPTDGAPETVATVPDLSGLSARAVLRLLGERGLEPDVSGSGRVVSQVPSAGAGVPPGSRVRVVLARAEAG